MDSDGERNASEAVIAIQGEIFDLNEKYKIICFARYFNAIDFSFFEEIG